MSESGERDLEELKLSGGSFKTRFGNLCLQQQEKNKKKQLLCRFK